MISMQVGTPVVRSPSDDLIRIVAVDRHRLVLLGLQKLLENAPRVSLEALVGSTAEALAAVEQHRPHIVLVEGDLGAENGYALVAAIRERAAKVILLITLAGAQAGERAMRAGAAGLVHSKQDPRVILQAIERVHEGELWIDRGITARVLESLLATDAAAAMEASSLTAAERRIITAVAEYRSLPNKQIAAELGISTHTLRNHLASIYRKLDVHRRFELVLYAMEHGLAKGAPTRPRRAA